MSSTFETPAPYQLTRAAKPARPHTPTALKIILGFLAITTVVCAVIAATGGFKPRSHIHRVVAGEEIELGGFSFTADHATVTENGDIAIHGSCVSTDNTADKPILSVSQGAVIVGMNADQSWEAANVRVTLNSQRPDHGSLYRTLAVGMPPVPCVFDGTATTDIGSPETVYLHLTPQEFRLASNVDGGEYSKTWVPAADSYLVEIPVRP